MAIHNRRRNKHSASPLLGSPLLRRRIGGYLDVSRVQFDRLQLGDGGNVSRRFKELAGAAFTKYWSRGRGNIGRERLGWVCAGGWRSSAQLAVALIVSVGANQPLRHAILETFVREEKDMSRPKIGESGYLLDFPRPFPPSPIP